MKFDAIIIGGGLSSLVCGIRLQEAGKQCLIVSAGQNALHFSTGTFGLLGRLPDGTAVEEPLLDIPKLPENHPYSKIGIERIKEYAVGVIPFFGKYGIKLCGFNGANGWRFTPMGTFKPAWLALEEIPFFKSPDEVIGHKALIVNYAGFMDFNSVFIAEGLEKKGLSCRIESVKLKVVENLRANPTEMRSINIARVMEQEECWKEFGRTVHSLLKDEDVVVVPEVFGLNNPLVCDWVREMIKANVLFVGTMPPSVAGIRTQKLLKKAFENIGGTFLMGDEALGSSISDGAVTSIKTRNLDGTLLEADDFVLASGHLFAHGLVASTGKIEEPVFGLDVDFVPDRNGWYDKNFFEKQNYLGFGVVTDSRFRAFRNGSLVDNLYVIGSEVGGCNSLNEGSGAGVAIMTALRVADEIIGG